MRLTQTGAFQVGAMRRYILLAVLGLALVGLTSGAADGKIPIYQVPVTLSSPGYYYLTQDVSGGAVTIAASNVTLDLNGHLLTSPGDGVIGSGSPTNIHVTNGSIWAGGVGLSLNLPNGGFAHVDHVRILNAPSRGMYILGPSTGSAASVRIEHNLVTGVTTSAGIEFMYICGAHIDGNEVRGLTTVSSALFLSYSHNNSLSNNACTSNAGKGIMLMYSDGNQLARNNCSSNGSDGICVSYSDNNSLTWNTVAGIGGVPYYGIGFYNASAGNVYAYNYTPGTASGINAGTGNIDGGGNH